MKYKMMKGEFNFDIMLDKLKKQEHFSYSRWGDGEWACLLQTRPGGQNCDHHKYFPDLGKELKDILESSPQYFLGLQRLATEQNQEDPEFRRLVEKNEWIDNEILTRASIKGRLNEFFEALKDRNVILVGNSGLRKIVPTWYNRFVEIPKNDCWLNFDEVLANLYDVIRIIESPVILYCASMMSNVLININYKLSGDSITQIDCGSVFDPYAGLQTRSYHKKLKIS